MGNDLAKLSVLIAASMIGVRELTGANDGPFIEDLQKWMDSGAGWMKGQPWCSTFASWCIRRAADRSGAKVQMPKSASTTALFNWYEEGGLLLPVPEAYSIGMLRGDGGSPGKTHHHTFFVESLDGDFVNGIDGNWQNAVSRSHHAVKDCDFGPIV